MLIFVQIASYRDYLLGSTLRDMLDKARYPENLRVTICHQYHPDDVFNGELDIYRTDGRFNIIDILYSESRGLSWARNMIQQHYKGEAYLLQIDSHMRFVHDWDHLLIEMLQSLQADGYAKPILTTYPPHFEPNDFYWADTPPNKIILYGFNSNGVIPVAWPYQMKNWRELRKPVPARFLAGGFTFTIGSFCQEIPNDPDLYFMGEEINMAIRAYTHGYDLFHPHINITWHYYGRLDSIRHWDDHGAVEGVETRAMDHLLRLFESSARDGIHNWGRYGLGSVRTLRDYEQYAGILLLEQKAQEYTYQHLPPPNPQLYTTEEAWKESFLSYVHHHISIPARLITERDYDIVMFTFMTNHQPVHQVFLDAEQLEEMHKVQTEYVIRFKFSCRRQPDSWILKMHSRDTGWSKSIRGRMPYYNKSLRNFSLRNCHI